MIYYASAAEFIRIARIPEDRRSESQRERFAQLDAPDEPDGF